ncbi:MAG: sigma-54-dependent Fis family transcriptional regulator [Deltaproteobacteria bacterium]|nr:sigma-54-dependent Fis family transcriptional regulator [Deltaproteobacteria bacterium]
MPRVLVIDDEERVGKAVRHAVEGTDLDCLWVGSGEEALRTIQEHEVDLVLTDLIMPHISGLDLVRDLRSRAPHIPILVMTAYGSIDVAVEAMRLGAEDFLSKPIESSRLRKSVERSLQLRQLVVENEFLKSEIERISGIGELVGRSRPFKDVINLSSQIAKSDGTVLVLGETGTGKELMARTIHYLSARSRNPFVVVNCVALSPSLLESELFGHERGAFTGAHERKKGRFEIAAGGTLFLDEIGEVNEAFQLRLLRFLQEKEFERVGGVKPIKANVRVIAATHRNLDQLVKEGKIRSDLYYRLNVLPVLIPPLRDRTTDIVPLTEHFLHRYGQILGKSIDTITPEAEASLIRYPWPGNIRELKNVIERSVVLDQDGILGVEDLSALRPATPEKNKDRLPYRTIVECVDYHTKEYILNTIEKHNGDKGISAKRLGVSRMTLHRLMRKLGIEG